MTTMDAGRPPLPRDPATFDKFKWTEFPPKEQQAQRTTGKHNSPMANQAEFIRDRALIIKSHLAPISPSIKTLTRELQTIVQKQPTLVGVEAQKQNSATKLVYTTAAIVSASFLSMVGSFLGSITTAIFPSVGAAVGVSAAGLALFALGCFAVILISFLAAGKISAIAETKFHKLQDEALDRHNNWCSETSTGTALLSIQNSTKTIERDLAIAESQVARYGNDLPWEQRQSFTAAVSDLKSELDSIHQQVNAINDQKSRGANTAKLLNSVKFIVRTSSHQPELP